MHSKEILHILMWITFDQGLISPIYLRQLLLKQIPKVMGFLGSGSVKGACKILEKLAPGANPSTLILSQRIYNTLH